MLKLEALIKHYGKIKSVDGIDLHIPRGEFFGLLGPNGAGKTTTIRMISTLTPKTSGTIIIDGQLMDRDLSAIKKRIGVVPQHNNLESEMTAYENLELHGRIYGMDAVQRKQQIETLLKFTELSDRKNDLVNTFSGGMKRRLMIARALMHNPELLLLDEPTVGLDAATRRKMWDLLKRLKEKGLTVLLTTHYIEEAETLCERIGLINEGKLIELDSPRALIDRMGAFIVENFENGSTHSSCFSDREEAGQYASKLMGTVNIRPTNLEDVFLKMTNRKVEN